MLDGGNFLQTIPSLKVYVIVDPEKPLVRMDRRKEIGGFTHEEYRD